MSRNINVNPDHYKVAGRERQGEAVLQGVERRAYAQQRAAADRWQTRRHEDTPGWEDPAQPLGPGKPPRRRRKSSAAKRRTPARRKAASTRSTRVKAAPRGRRATSSKKARAKKTGRT